MNRLQKMASTPTSTTFSSKPAWRSKPTNIKEPAQQTSCAGSCFIADKMLAISASEVAKQGTQNEPLAKDGFYANLYDVQFKTGMAI